MAHALLPLLRHVAACPNRAFGMLATRFAIVVAVAGSAHAATPYAVRVTGSGPDVLLIPGLASSGAADRRDGHRARGRRARAGMGPAVGSRRRHRRDDRHVSTLEATRAIYARQYKTLAGVQVAMSPAGRHFIMLDDPGWFEMTLAAFVQ